MKKRAVSKTQKRKVGKKAGQARHRNAEKPRKNESKNLPVGPFSISQRAVVQVEPPVREYERITLESIRGETTIGDLLVAFPRTREVLVKKGLRLEAEDAGDIYMSLEAFSAMNGLSVKSLLEEVVVVAREPPPLQPLPPLVASPIA